MAFSLTGAQTLLLVNSLQQPSQPLVVSVASQLTESLVTTQFTLTQLSSVDTSRFVSSVLPGWQRRLW